MIHNRTRRQTQFVVLPPVKHSLSRSFQCLEVNNRRYSELLAEMQRFRGSVYLNDGAIPVEELTSDGRHRAAVDESSWHVLSLDEDGQVCACLRYLEETAAATFDDLWVRHAAMAQSPVGQQFRSAVERQLADARRMQLKFGEVGGWAVAEKHRWTLEPLRIILATYSLLEILGGCIGVATATFRHRSATILRRIGLASLCADGMELPPYFDPRYGCQMEILRFDSRFPNPKYRDWVAEFRSSLTESPVICAERPRTKACVFPRRFGVVDAFSGIPDLVPAASML